MGGKRVWGPHWQAHAAWLGPRGWHTLVAARGGPGGSQTLGKREQVKAWDPEMLTWTLQDPFFFLHDLFIM